MSNSTNSNHRSPIFAPNRSVVRYGDYDLYSHTFHNLERKDVKKGFKVSFEAFLVGEDDLRLAEDVVNTNVAESVRNAGNDAIRNAQERAHTCFPGQHLRYYYRWNYFDVGGAGTYTNLFLDLGGQNFEHIFMWSG